MTVSDTKTKAARPKTSRKASQPQEKATPRLTRVGVKEFRDKATQLLAQDAPFAVERHGKVIGFYTPLSGSPEQQGRIVQAATRLDDTMNRVAGELGLSLDELEDLLVGEKL